MTRKIIYSIIAIILLFLAAAPTYAQGQSPITATVDRTALSTGETLNLMVTVTTDLTTMPQPLIPSLAGFNILGTSTSSQINIINGAINSQVIYNYQLQPTQTGDLVINPISLTINGQNYTTPPITIQVSQGSGAPAPQPAPSTRQAAPTSTGFNGQDVFVEAEVSHPNPYLGEQVTYTFRLYQIADIFSMFDQPYFELPAFTGFWSEGQPAQNQYRVQAGGAIYNVTEVSTLLFPSKVGQLTIEPAQISVPGGFFSSSQQLQTEPISMEVKPLPANAPVTFNGAVGQFSLSSTVDTTETKVNEPITWQINLNGYGNLKAIPEPAWPEMPDWRSYDSQTSINSDNQKGQMGGYTVYERLLVPLKEGQYTLPALEYSYFDPTTGQYQTLTTEPIPVTVAPGDGVVSQSPVSLPPAQTNFTETAASVTTDIHHLKPVPAELSFAERPVTESPLYWLAWSIPLVGLVGHFAWQRREQYWQHHRSLARSSQAGKRARKTLAQARQSRQDIYSIASQALTDYLADKFDQPVAGLTQSALTELLAKYGLPANLIARVMDCLTAVELGRYAPGADQPAHAENLLQELDELIRDLEKAL
jgi:hypothetical protein